MIVCGIDYWWNDWKIFNVIYSFKFEYVGI